MATTTPRLLVGTGNRHKVEEIAALLAALPLEVTGCERLPRQPAVAETGATFEENAALKALAFARAAGELPREERPRWVLADDSGLCVDALGGAPGIHSARYAASPGSAGNSPAEANNRKLLEALRDVPPERRGARFACALALVEVPGKAGEEPQVAFTARGECRGRIIEAGRGQGGFGYDPLFLIPDLGLTFAELPAVEKNRRSHRGRALRRLRQYLARALGSGC
ncbi:MAG: RdgB/HAM1 family non-canonical purine NTP pyrophosphatase [Planctomycetes bacterium]|nr:RdgB/HAM1 family non-canonical purine NTP pyrophosphatase [Planctomycetota bacterium]